MEKIWVSSAQALALDDKLMKNRSLMWMLNSKGPNTDPYGINKKLKILPPNISSYNIFPQMDQIQEKKTTKSTFRNISKNASFSP